MSRQPIVVIVGRPNVGKSTLFNRLTQSRRALVHDRPGVTRDRIVAEAVAANDRRVAVVDTGGLMLEDEDPFVSLIRGQAQIAIETADVVLFLLDGASGPIPEDIEIAHGLRAIGRPVVPVVNKADRSEVDLARHEFFRLGLGEPVMVSAEHGTGIDELWDAIAPHLDWAVDGDEEPYEEVAPSPDSIVNVAIIGRPNSGKSSLLNRLVGDERVLVSEVAGTTRDSVDVLLEQDSGLYRIVDTAGIRRKGRTERGPEVLSVMMARRSLERADVCLLVVDVDAGIARQDAHVAGYAWDAGKPIVIVANKWDLVEDRSEGRERLTDDVFRQLKFARHAPLVPVSALTGEGVHRLLPAVRHLAGAAGRRVPTSELNRLLEKAWSRRPPPASGGKVGRFYYATQVGASPPRFVLFTNLGDQVHFSYLRYIENVLREVLGLEGVPIRVMIRGRKD